MHSGCGSPFDICSRLKGDDGAFAACSESVETCVKQEKEGAFDDDAQSAFELVDAAGKKYTPSSMTQCRAVAYLVGVSYEGGEGAPASAILIDRKSAPDPFEEGAIVVVGKDGKEAEKLAAANAGKKVYLIDVSYSDDASRREAMKDVAFVLSLKMQDAASAVDGEAPLVFKNKGGRFVSAGSSGQLNSKKDKGAAEAGIVYLDKDTPESEYEGGSLFAVGNLGREKDRKTLEALANKASPKKVFFMSAGHSGDGSRRDAVRTVASVLSMSMQDAAKLVDSKELAVFVKSGDKFKRSGAEKDASPAPADSKQMKDVEEAKKRRENQAAQLDAERAAAKSRRSEVQPKADEEITHEKVLQAAEEVDDLVKEIVDVYSKAAGIDKGKESKKVAEGAKAAPGPMGFIESSPDTIDAILNEIRSGKYPVMVVIGQEAKNLDEKNCDHCIEFKKELVAAQNAGGMQYHRLVFINLNRPSAIKHMERLGILEKVKDAGFVPQAYVFKDKKRLTFDKDMNSYMKGLRDDLRKSVSTDVKPDATKEASEEIEKAPEETDKKAPKEALDAKAADPDWDDFEDEVDDEAKVELKKRRLASDELWRKADDIKGKLSGLILTKKNIGGKWKKGAAVDIVFTTFFDDAFAKRIEADKPDGIVDLATPEGRALARDLKVSMPPPGMADQKWTLECGDEAGTFINPRWTVGSNFSVTELLKRYSFRPNPSGIYFAADELALDEHLTSNGDEVETVLLVGDPISDRAMEFVAGLLDEKNLREQKWRIIWLPHTDSSDATPLLDDLDIVRNRSVPVEAFRLNSDKDWVSFKPSGFVEASARQDIGQYIYGDDQPTILVVGTDSGAGAKETMTLKQDLVYHRAFFEMNDKEDYEFELRGKRMVYVDMKDILEYYTGTENLQSNDMLKEEKGLPRVFLYSEGRNRREVDEIPLKDLPTAVKPAAPKKTEPQAKPAPEVKKTEPTSLRDRKNRGAEEFVTQKIASLDVKPSDGKIDVNFTSRSGATIKSGISVGDSSDDKADIKKINKQVLQRLTKLFFDKLLPQKTQDEMAKIAEEGGMSDGAKVVLRVLYYRGMDKGKHVGPVKGDTKVKISFSFKNSESLNPSKADCIGIDPKLAKRIMDVVAKSAEGTLKSGDAREIFEVPFEDTITYESGRKITLTLSLPKFDKKKE